MALIGVGGRWDSGVVLIRYRRVLVVPALRRALVLGFLVRMPIFAGGVVITLHVVSHLHRSYGAAGLVSAAATVAIAISGTAHVSATESPRPSQEWWKTKTLIAW